MKNTKYRAEIFSFYDHTGIAAHLERMALKGWALEKVGNFLWRYQRIEPARLRYAVVYQPSASEFDSRPTEEVRQFEAFCNEAGWLPVASRAQMQIYKNEDLHAVPIETDPKIQADTIHQAMKKNHIPSQIMLIVLSLLQFILVWLSFDLDPLSFLAGSGNLLALVCYAMIIVMALGELITYYRWRKKALESESFCPSRGTQKLQIFCLAVVLVLAAVWMLSLTDGFMRFVCFATLAMCLTTLGASFGSKALMKRLGASRNATRAVVAVAIGVCLVLSQGAILYVGQKANQENWFEPDVETYEWEGWTWEAHHDALPLYIQDLTETDYADYSTRLNIRRSPILSITTGAQEERAGHSGSPNLRFEIYESIFPGWIEDLVTEEYTVRDYWGPRIFLDAGVELPETEVTRLWEENIPHNTWLLRRGNRIVVLMPDWELTPQQLAVAAEKLFAP